MIEQLTLEEQDQIQQAADRYSNLPQQQDQTSIAYLMSATGRNGFIAGIEWYLNYKEKNNDK